MRLGSSKGVSITLRVMSLSLALGLTVGASTSLTTMSAYAQQQPTNAQNNMMIAPPPQGNLVQGNMDPSAMMAQQIQPAPRLEPMLSPQDFAAKQAYEAQQIAAQQQAQQAAAQQQMGQQQLQAQQLQAMPAQQMQQPVAQQMQMQVPQPQAMPQQVVMPTQQAPAIQQAVTPAPTPDAVPTAQQEVPQTVTITNATGYAPDAANAKIPSTSGMLPAAAVTTNAGMDMSINPDLVGGYDPSMPAGPNNPVPYEVQLEQRTRELQDKARAMAFEQAKKSALPMETYEIRDVLGRLKDTQEAIQTPARPAPTPSNVIKTVSTDPSAKPQIIKLAVGNVTTLNVIDVTGEPWPIVDIGFGGAFDVKPPEAGGHVIRITPLRDFARGNLVIRLLKMTTPIAFQLRAGGDSVFYRFDARVPEYGPNAKMPLIGEGIGAHAGDKVTTSFLEGVPPTGAVKLNVEGIDARTTAYRFSGTMYIRTPLSLLSPAWQGSATSADGMNVYLLQETPVLLLSDKGSLVRARISEQKKTNLGF